MNLFGVTIEPEQFALILGVLLAISEILGTNPKFKSNSIFQLVLNLLKLIQGVIVKKKPVELAKDELIEEIKIEAEEKVESLKEDKDNLEELKSKLEELEKEEKALELVSKPKTKAKPKRKTKAKAKV